MQTQVQETPKRPQRQVGFFHYLSADGKHLGAILVTNHIGVPLEFKYTEPVTMNRLQRILYGAVLDQYIHETVIRDSLGRELHSDPKYFITNFDEKEFLGKLAGREMIAIQELRAAASDPAGSYSRTRDREALVEIEGGPTLKVLFSTSEGAAQQEIAAWIRDLGRTMDLLEPMERIRTALKTIMGDDRRRLGLAQK